MNTSDDTIRTDKVGDTTFVGLAPTGALETESVWTIMRITETAGGDCSVTYAGGTKNNINAWVDRLTLTYT